MVSAYPVNARCIIISILCVLLMACGEKTEPQVRIGIHVWPGYDSLIVARELGYLADSGVKLIETPSASESIRAFQNKTVDGAFLTIDEALRLSDHGHDPAIILITDFSNGADALLGQPGISEIAELKGKTIGIEPNAVGAYVLARALAQANLAPRDVSTISMPIIETEKAFLDKRVDAVVTYEPHLTRIKNAGGTSLFDSSQIPGEITDVLVVRNNIIETSPKALQHLVDSHFKVLALISEGNEQALSLIAQREKVSVAELQSLLGGLTMPDKQNNSENLSSQNTRLPEAISRLATVMKEHKMLSPTFKETELRDDRFVNNASN